MIWNCSHSAVRVTLVELQLLLSYLLTLPVSPALEPFVSGLLCFDICSLSPDSFPAMISSNLILLAVFSCPIPLLYLIQQKPSGSLKKTKRCCMRKENDSFFTKICLLQISSTKGSNTIPLFLQCSFCKLKAVNRDMGGDYIYSSAPNTLKCFSYSKLPGWGLRGEYLLRALWFYGFGSSCGPLSLHSLKVCSSPQELPMQ